MKTLLLMRHAKSSHDEPVADHDRPLNRRGMHDAPDMGKLIKKKHLVPDRIISSTALRALETAELVAEACGYEGELDQRRSLYLASPNAYLDVLRSLPDDPKVVLLIGHNPGMAELVSRLSDEDHAFPTAALAHFEWKIKSWADVRLDAKVGLLNLWTPK